MADGAAWSAPANPSTIDVDRAEAVTITWDDGHVSRFGLEGLRISCPCAECRGLREMGEEAWPRPGKPTVLQATSAGQVGNWGLNLHWNDGHTTGIYTWEILRAWCPCEACAAMKDADA